MIALKAKFNVLSNGTPGIFGEDSLRNFSELADPTNQIKDISEFSNEDEFYRVIVGDMAFNDITESGVVRTNAGSKSKKEGVGINLEERPVDFPAFSKGNVSIGYAKSNPNHYIIVTKDKSMQPSRSGRHGKGTTLFPTDKNGNHLKALDAKKVCVYKHVGGGKYELVISAVNTDGDNEGADKKAAPQVAQPTKIKRNIQLKTVNGTTIQGDRYLFPGNERHPVIISKPNGSKGAGTKHNHTAWDEISGAPIYSEHAKPRGEKPSAQHVVDVVSNLFKAGFGSILDGDDSRLTSN